MKRTTKLFAAGAAVVAAAGALAYKQYLNSYNQLEEANEDDDFVPMEYVDDDFEYVVDEDQIMFDE